VIDSLVVNQILQLTAALSTQILILIMNHNKRQTDRWTEKWWYYQF